MEKWLCDWKDVLTKPKFWLIQCINMVYVIKYYSWFSFYTLIMVVFLRMLKVQIDLEYAEKVSEVVVLFFLIMFMCLPIVSLLKVVIDVIIQKEGGQISQFSRFFKVILFAVVLYCTPYLEPDFIAKSLNSAVVIDKLGNEIGQYLIVFLACSVIIRLFWRSKGSFFYVKSISSEKLFFSAKVGLWNDWSNFVKTERILIEYYDNSHAETIVEETAVVRLKYSFVVRNLKRKTIRRSA
ncbi:hypothetical protein ACFC3Z_13370 [Enterococcus thailandicus]|uniref:hypothetical protein n=1 Tax=Enterococcus thailandicus TaxID=417368 RepID=UPI0035DE1C28